MPFKKPDIVIVDKKFKSVNIFELTIPGETRLDTAHSLKTEAYSDFVRDIKSNTVTVTPFEVEAHKHVVYTRPYPGTISKPVTIRENPYRQETCRKTCDLICINLSPSLFFVV